MRTLIATAPAPATTPAPFAAALDDVLANAAFQAARVAGEMDALRAQLPAGHPALVTLTALAGAFKALRTKCNDTPTTTTDEDTMTTATRPALPPLPYTPDPNRPTWMRPGTFTLDELASLPGTYEAYEVAARATWDAAVEAANATGAPLWTLPYTPERDDEYGRYAVEPATYGMHDHDRVTGYGVEFRTDTPPWEAGGYGDDRVRDRWFLPVFDPACDCGCHKAINEPPF